MDRQDAILDEARQALIEGQLTQGRTEEQCIAAIRGCASSMFHMGHNDDEVLHNEIRNIFVDADRFEFFLELGSRKTNQQKIFRIRVLKGVRDKLNESKVTST